VNNNPRKTALVTGASSGIGKELARQLAAADYDLVLVARSASRLHQLAAELAEAHGIGVRVIVKDLVDPKAPEDIYHELQSARINVHTLINNAGFGSFGPFDQSEHDGQLDMVRVNIIALINLTHLFVQHMINDGDGAIMNLASVAAFQSGPKMAVYSATKAFVLSFSEALSTELLESGVRVLALCPGATLTQFSDTADMEGHLAFKIGAMNAESVAKIGLAALAKDKVVEVPGVQNWMATQLVPLMPRAIVRRLVNALQNTV